MTSAVLFWALSALAVTGALSVVLSADLMRMGLGLGGFFLALAGFFALFGFSFLALAEVFLYVGGVLVLIMFATILVRRESPGEPRLDSRFDVSAGAACALLGIALVSVLSPLTDQVHLMPSVKGSSVSELLLGDLIVPFELAGLLLLAALVAVVVVSREDRS